MTKKEEIEARRKDILNLLKDADREHPVKLDTLMNRYGAARRTIYDDIKMLQESGYAVENVSRKGFYLSGEEEKASVPGTLKPEGASAAATEYAYQHKGMYRKSGVETFLEGYLLAIVSNKVDTAVKALAKQFFPEIPVAIGEREGIRRKPAPDTALQAMEELGVTREESIYVGDSEVDLATARAAGIPCISVLWGFREKKLLEAEGATCFVTRPEEIPGLIVGQSRLTRHCGG